MQFEDDGEDEKWRVQTRSFEARDKCNLAHISQPQVPPLQKLGMGSFDTAIIVEAASRAGVEGFRGSSNPAWGLLLIWMDLHT
jgi:hypothetical protein